MRTVTLKNWAVIIPDPDPYLPPEYQVATLHGETFGDDRRADGKRICTSEIIGKQGTKIQTRSGTLYILDIVNPEYEKIYPNALNRLLDSLPELGILKD